MAVCCCSLAGTSACKSCVNNPFCDWQPPVRTYTVSATDPVLITGRKTNADRIRSMTDEELAEWIADYTDCLCKIHKDGCSKTKETCVATWFDWLKQEVSE